MLETLKRREPGSETGGSSVGLRHPAPDWPSEKSEGPFWRCRATAAAAAAGGGTRGSPALTPTSWSRPRTALLWALPLGLVLLSIWASSTLANLCVTQERAGVCLFFVFCCCFLMLSICILSCVKSPNKLENLDLRSEMHMNGLLPLSGLVTSLVTIFLKH